MTTASQILRAIADNHGVTPLPNHEPSFWLRARIADLHARWTAHQTLTCRHVIEQPHRPAMTALWLPHVMVCLSCAPRALSLPESANHVCDRCEVHDPETRPMSVDERGVIVALGLCPSCYAREVPA